MAGTVSGRRPDTVADSRALINRRNAAAERSWRPRYTARLHGRCAAVTGNNGVTVAAKVHYT